MPHLVVSITGHGFGHVSQTAPVLNRLHEWMPEVHMTIRTAVPLAHLRSRIRAPFEYLPSSGDLGMVMSSALDVRAGESRETYRTAHQDWDARVAAEASLLDHLGASLVLSNVGYLPLAGAQRKGIPNAAMCSLNWFDIYSHYCGSDAIAPQIHSCYAAADVFFRLAPGMPMNSLQNRVAAGPVAAVGRDRRHELNQYLHLEGNERLVLVSLGGIDSRLPVEHWPRLDGVRWLVQRSWQADHPDSIVLETLPMDFGDLLASVDALLCKPGYGSFVEAACSGTPVIYVDRPDWPEAPYLVEWLQRSCAQIKISRAQLESGAFASELTSLWASPKPSKPLTEGIAQITEWLVNRLSSVVD